MNPQAPTVKKLKKCAPDFRSRCQEGGGSYATQHDAAGSTHCLCYSHYSLLIIVIIKYLKPLHSMSEEVVRYVISTLNSVYLGGDHLDNFFINHSKKLVV